MDLRTSARWTSLFEYGHSDPHPLAKRHRSEGSGDEGAGHILSCVPDGLGLGIEYRFTTSTDQFDWGSRCSKARGDLWAEGYYPQFSQPSIQHRMSGLRSRTIIPDRITEQAGADEYFVHGT
jgi:hypothetical protein